VIRSRLALALVAVVVLVGGPTRAESSGKPMVVKIHADWCGTCRKLEPTFAALERQLGDDASIVVLDVTDRPALERSRAEADRLGIRPFLDANQAKTGTVGVLDATGKPVKVLRGELDPAAYVAAVHEAGG
jgi:thiol-disulfide isomerase/thioredoxin